MSRRIINTGKALYFGGGYITFFSGLDFMPKVVNKMNKKYKIHDYCKALMIPFGAVSIAAFWPISIPGMALYDIKYCHTH